MALLGIDIGTTGSKATLFSDEGKVLSYAYREYKVENPRPGWFELNPITVWDAVKDVIRRACREHGGEAVKAICTSSLGEAFVCLDKDGKELANSAIYMDVRGEEECRLLSESVGVMPIMERTGHPPHPMYSICKLMWLRRNRPDILEKTAHIHFYGDYILYKLGACHSMDYSLAARSMAFDVVRKRWDGGIFRAADLDEAVFPEANVAGTAVGEIAPSVADELGVSRKAKLILGAHDQIMCAVGAGVRKSGEAANSIGTVDCITPVYDRPKLTEKMAGSAYNCMPYIFENTYVTYAFSMTGGSLLRWFRDEFARLDKIKAAEEGQDIYRLLETGMPEQPTNLFVLPHFAGSPVPNVDIQAKGAILNLSFDTRREDIYRACMEGETFEMKHNLKALQENGIETDILKTVGGGSRSEAFMQIRADILGRPVVTMEIEEAGTLGTAILAGAASGVYASVPEACGALNSVKKVFEPDRKNMAYYEDRYEKYLKIYDFMKLMR